VLPGSTGTSVCIVTVKIAICATGLGARQDAAMLDLLAAEASPISLRDHGVASAFTRLTSLTVESEDDIQLAIRRSRVLRAAGSTGRDRPSQQWPQHVMLNLHLTTRPGSAVAEQHTLSFVELVAPDVKV
jgi:hypothetical protein